MARRKDPLLAGVAILTWVVALAIVIMIAVLIGLRRSHARDMGQWEATDPTIREWYRSLMQPDIPTASCCGEADAYFCDDYRLDHGQALCTISDDRPDAPRGRPHRDVGEVIEIPPNKIGTYPGNPTGHGVVFLSRGGHVFCFVQGGGV
mgnify:CR=1 FL=1